MVKQFAPKYFSCGSSDKRICLQCRRPRFNPWVRKIPWRRAWAVFLPGEFYGQRSLAGYSPWGHTVGAEHDWAHSRHTVTWYWQGCFYDVHPAVRETLCRVWNMSGKIMMAVFPLLDSITITGLHFPCYLGGPRGRPWLDVYFWVLLHFMNGWQIRMLWSERELGFLPFLNKTTHGTKVSNVDICQPNTAISLCVYGCARRVWFFCDPVDCSMWDSSLHGVFQARILEWGDIPFSRGSSWPRDRTLSLESPALGGRSFISSTTWEATDIWCQVILIINYYAR